MPHRAVVVKQWPACGHVSGIGVGLREEAHVHILMAASVLVVQLNDKGTPEAWRIRCRLSFKSAEELPAFRLLPGA